MVSVLAAGKTKPAARLRWAQAAPRSRGARGLLPRLPDAGPCALLANARLVLEPDFDRLAGGTAWEPWRQSYFKTPPGPPHQPADEHTDASTRLAKLEALNVEQDRVSGRARHHHGLLLGINHDPRSAPTGTPP